jgi:hypothetical protein
MAVSKLTKELARKLPHQKGLITRDTEAKGLCVVSHASCKTY